jgi:hypothetical protein
MTGDRSKADLDLIAQDLFEMTREVGEDDGAFSNRVLLAMAASSITPHDVFVAYGPGSDKGKRLELKANR